MGSASADPGIMQEYSGSGKQPAGVQKSSGQQAVQYLATNESN
jgi:hypothetical protein